MMTIVFFMIILPWRFISLCTCIQENVRNYRFKWKTKDDKSGQEQHSIIKFNVESHSTIRQNLYLKIIFTKQQKVSRVKSFEQQGNSYLLIKYEFSVDCLITPVQCCATSFSMLRMIVSSRSCCKVKKTFRSWTAASACSVVTHGGGSQQSSMSFSVSSLASTSPPGSDS